MYKYKRNGFTLVELMAVIIIISLIALLTFPNIINQIKKTKKSNNKMIEDVVIEQAKKYVSDNKDEFDKDTYIIDVKDLIDNGYVKEELIKASSKELNTKYILFRDNKYSITDEAYVQLEYIESTGTQYIDTLYVPKKNTKLELDIKFSDNFKNNCTSIFSSNNNQTSVFQLNFGGQSYEYNRLYPWIDKPYGKGGTPKLIDINDNIRQNRNIITMQSGFISYGTVSRTLSEKTSDNDINLILFGGYQSDGTICSFDGYHMFVYGLKLYEGDVLKRDYIPVLDSNGIACLYDKIEGKFYYNQGTGEFLSDIQQEINFIESTGTQYIDTGVKPNHNTTFEIKVMRLNSSISNPALFGVATPFLSLATSNANLYYAFNNAGTGEISSTFDINETAVFRNEKEKIYKNNTLVKTLTSQENFQSNLNIVLFGRNTNNGVERLGNFRIFYFKLFDNGKLVRYYIPYLDNGRPCLFDKVEKKCYYNQGTGEFLYG